MNFYEMFMTSDFHHDMERCHLMDAADASIYVELTRVACLLMDGTLLQHRTQTGS
jgi:hypothetical protein